MRVYLNRRLNLAAVILTTLRLKKISLPQEMVDWYMLYHQYIVIHLNHEQLIKTLEQLLTTPLNITVNEQKNWIIQNKILFYYLLFSHKQHLSLPNIVDIKRSKYSSHNNREIFEELILIIKLNKQHLPIKSLHLALKNLLTVEDCNHLFRKNTFTTKQYCFLIDISLATYKRAS